jgi:hypothetical protein
VSAGVAGCHVRPIGGGAAGVAHALARTLICFDPRGLIEFGSGLIWILFNLNRTSDQFANQWLISFLSEQN